MTHPFRPPLGRRAFLAGLLATLAWGLFAFGGNYPAVYRPLFTASLCVGFLGIWCGSARLPKRTLCGLALVAFAAALQLVPLPRGWIAAALPATDGFLLTYDVAYAAGAATHPSSIAPASTQLGIAILVALTALLAGTARMADRRLLKEVTAGIATIGALVALAGIIQQSVWNGKIYGFWTPLSANAAPFGPFVNRNHFAGCMLLVLPLTAGLLVSQLQAVRIRETRDFRSGLLWVAEPGGSHALLTVFAMVTMTVALVLTASRSGILCLAVTCAGAGALAARPGVSRRASRMVTAAWLVPLAAVLWTGIDLAAARFAQPDVMSLAGRVGIWSDTLRIARDFWIAGTGLNTYGVATLEYQSVIPLFHVREAHNEYLQLIAEGGLLLGIPVVAAIAMFVVDARRSLASSSGSAYWIQSGALGGIAAVALQSAVDFSLQMPGNAALFAVLCGVAINRFPEEARSATVR